MEQQPRLPLWFLLVNCGLIATAFIAGTMLGGKRHVEFPQPQSDALQVIYREIIENHVEEQDGQVLLDRAIAALAGNLDDYSRYVPPSEVARYEESTTGRYEGVGMVMQQHGPDIVNVARLGRARQERQRLHRGHLAHPAADADKHNCIHCQGR
jgi:hypothetical protein